MMGMTLRICAVLMFTGALMAAETSNEELIAEATSALPHYLRDGASVIVPDGKGGEDTLRKGSNTFVCSPDDPDKHGFEVMCAEESAVRFRKKVVPIRARATSKAERIQLIDEAIRDGALKPLRPGTRAYILSGPNREEARSLMVIVLPFATADSTELPTERDPSGVWLMCPGAVNAHIMIGDIPYGADENIVKTCGR
jgi:hypothetical protein